MTGEQRFRKPGTDGPPSGDEAFFREEVLLALRNRGIPLEALRYDVTPTGLHYLLTHFDIPFMEAGSWALTVDGLVERPLRLSLQDIMSKPARTLRVTLECAGNGRALMSERAISQPWHVEAVSTADWTGVSLRDVLLESGVKPGAVDVVFTGADEGVQGEEVQLYQRSLPLAEALHEDTLLAFAMNGEPLPPQHGFPLRLIVPGWYGMASVKWLQRIEVLDHAFTGFQMVHSYRYAATADEPGEPVDRIQARALMAPPGIPDFMTRARLVSAGTWMLTGRAWSGRRGIDAVQVSVDRGATWLDAILGPVAGPYAWRAWTCDWEATPGRYELRVRAIDSEGAVQPDDQWNFYGMGNNMVQRVEVLVE